MKKSHVLFGYSILFALVCILGSCRKPKDPVKPKDPCANKILVSALDTNYYYWAHFELSTSGSQSNWLFAINWSNYASRVKPGKQYRIAYTEVSCQDDRLENKTGNNKTIGGCFAHPVKCIRIICFEDVIPYTLPRTCLFSEMNPSNFESEISNAQKGISVNGNEFKIKIAFSGCDITQKEHFRLMLQEVRFKNNSTKYDRIFLAKAVLLEKTTCKPYFETEQCFDLTPLNNYMRTEGLDMSKPVIIRLVNLDGTETDYTYQP